MTDIDPTWPWWLILLVVLSPVIVTTLGVVLVAKINKQAKFAKVQSAMTSEVHDHIVNSHATKNLRNDIDELKSAVDSVDHTLKGVAIRIRDIKELQRIQGESLDRRYGILATSIEEAAQDRIRDITRHINEHVSRYHTEGGSS